MNPEDWKCKGEKSMEDIFIFLIVLSGLLIGFCTVAYLYYAKKEAEESKKLTQLLRDGKINQETYVQLRIKREKEKTYRDELNHLALALASKKISQETFERMKKELLKKYQEK